MISLGSCFIQLDWFVVVKKIEYHVTAIDMSAPPEEGSQKKFLTKGAKILSLFSWGRDIFATLIHVFGLSG